MPDWPSQQPFIFISYKREEIEYARDLNYVLTSLGYPVWFDESLQAGQRWAEVLQRRMEEASAVIVLWSRRSIRSPWVLHEATHALARGRYVPVRLEVVEVPRPYSENQCADLMGWDGTHLTAEFEELETRLQALLGDFAPRTRLNAAPDRPGALWPWPDRVRYPLLDRIRVWIAANSFGLLASLLGLLVVGTVTQIARTRLDSVTYALDRQIERLGNTLTELREQMASMEDQFSDQMAELAGTSSQIAASTTKLQDSMGLIETQLGVLDVASSDLKAQAVQQEVLFRELESRVKDLPQVIDRVVVIKTNAGEGEGQGDGPNLDAESLARDCGRAQPHSAAVVLAVERGSPIVSPCARGDTIERLTLANARLYDSVFESMGFPEAKWNGVDVIGGDWSEVTFSHANLDDVSFSGAAFSNLVFRQSTVRNVRLTLAMTSSMDMTESTVDVLTIVRTVRCTHERGSVRTRALRLAESLVHRGATVVGADKEISAGTGLRTKLKAEIEKALPLFKGPCY